MYVDVAIKSVCLVQFSSDFIYKCIFTTQARSLDFAILEGKGPYRLPILEPSTEKRARRSPSKKIEI